MYQIESLLSARLFLAPQVIGEYIYFISNLSGKLSLYRMRHGGSVPEPLLPPHIALQNPDLAGHPFHVFPGLDKIVVMIDHDGDENYQPMLIPMDGGFPEPAFNNFFAPYRAHMHEWDVEQNLLYLSVDSRTEPMRTAYQCNLATGAVLKLGESQWGCHIDGVSADNKSVMLADGYAAGDNVLYKWTAETGERALFFGRPIEARQPGESIPLNSIGNTYFTPDGQGVLVTSSLFSDSYGPGFIHFSKPTEVLPVAVNGLAHSGAGEFSSYRHIKDDHFLLFYNIDGCSWVYEATFNSTLLALNVISVLVGRGMLSNGVLEAINYDKQHDRLALSFSTATSPTQIYTIEGDQRDYVIRHTNERLLGLPSEILATGEDASFISHDGLRISARLYLPTPALGFTGPHPLVYYIHGGPQSQEKPDFAWFSMPLIQFLCLNGFAVFVPNVRGSSGYGLSYMKHVDKDWGGQDRLDHVFAMTQVLPKDSRLDTRRAAVVGRSYGGYMTLTLAGRHPDLWAAACDMFGPYDLTTFVNRLPETWKPYFHLILGNPSDPADLAFLAERSPKTYLSQLACPMLVIQGKNDPRVIERESRDVVEQLTSQGKQIEYLMFENEGHDVLKYENRVACYNAITDFFKRILKP